MQKTFFFLLLTILLAFSCKTGEKIATTKPTPEATAMEFRDLDTMVVAAEKPVAIKTAEEYKLPRYAPSYELKNDLVHTKLDLKFDWTKEWVIGKAELTLKPYFYPTDELVLDAKNFDIQKITLATGKELQYDYDKKIIKIQLNREYKSSEYYKVLIDYIAKPSEGAIGGSLAITSDKGLFFINADGSERDKPQQIWTQGETENNSRWFPTIDKPNERCTQETYLTVRNEFKTLSNGVLVSSKKNTDGTRTDYWKMEQPHAPYLFMVAVGDFAKVEDQWRGIPVNYYVEPEYKEYAKDIFAHTPEMLSFFSEKLGLDYMWPKYSQIIVRDYVSGAMENTTGVIFGDFIQKTARELIDDPNDYIVAHELFHHWFGDYVTCESWANLTMNEGFANYSEYLWFEHKYGRDEADYHRIKELDGYLGSVQGGSAHPLIWFSNPDKEAMFDQHSYNKGGLVLHMLRHYVGDEAFFEALNKYLKDNAYTAVEAHDLRLAFEDVTGQDLNWFFNQWFFEAGHPQLTIEYDYDATSQTASVTIEQTQDPEKSIPIFQLPIAIDIYENPKKVSRKNVLMNLRKQTFTFPAATKPALINVDADKVLLAERVDNKTEAEYIFQFYHAPALMDRFEAIQFLNDKKTPEAKKVIKAALKDNYWLIRNIGLGFVEPDDETLEEIAKLATGDVHSQVRASALGYLTEVGYSNLPSIASKILDNEKAYPVINTALVALYQADPEKAVEKAETFEKDADNSSILSAVGGIYALQGRTDKIPFFEANWNKVDGPDAMDFFAGYAFLLQAGDKETVQKSLENLRNVSTNMEQSMWRRFAATKTLADLKEYYTQLLSETTEATDKTTIQDSIKTIETYISEIKKAETSKELSDLYQSY